MFEHTTQYNLSWVKATNNGNINQIIEIVRKNSDTICEQIAQIRSSGRTVLGIESDLLGEGNVVVYGVQEQDHVVLQTAVYYETIEHAIKCHNCGSMNVPAAEKCKGCGQAFHSNEARHV